MIQPGATIGILGGGQLGRMLIIAGRPLGYRFHLFDPKGPSTAGRVADLEINADYSDTEALTAFAQGVDIITLEFENIPAEAIKTLQAIKPVLPGCKSLHTCQHRQREKDFLQAGGFPCAPFAYADSAQSLADAVQSVGLPCVVKTAAFGYDGKGQLKLEAKDAGRNFDALWNQLGTPPRVVVETWIHHKGEFSVVCARRADGAVHTFPMAENIHCNHILHASILPARVPQSVEKDAAKIAQALANALELVGLLAVEFFLDEDGTLIVNEMAPRPHNSGHYSIEACPASQFEQHIRAVCGIPFGSTELLRPTVMINLLGDLWQSEHPTGNPFWQIPLPNCTSTIRAKHDPAERWGTSPYPERGADDALAAAEKHFLALSESLLAATPS